MSLSRAEKALAREECIVAIENAINQTTFRWGGMKLVSVDQFDRATIAELFSVTDVMKSMVNRVGGCDLLTGKILTTIFFEASTRTMCSFETAMQRLGGQVVRVNASTSSAKKGETLQDTIRCLECYTDISVLRHPQKGSVPGVAKYTVNPLLNAGDGVGEPPTQALLDLYTIHNELGGKVDGLTVVLLGDLKNGRTVHSLSRLLTNYSSITLRMVSPASLAMPDEVKEALDTSSITYTEHRSLHEVMSEADVIYVTRVQKERFEDPEEYLKVQGTFDICAQTLKDGNAKDDMIIMHPLPRVGEIHEDVDSDPRAAYFRQMKNGMFVRMALVALLLKAA